jgi:hypothetical protein
VHRVVGERRRHVGWWRVHVEQQVRVVDHVGQTEGVGSVKARERVPVDDQQVRAVVLQVLEQRREHGALEGVVEPQCRQVALIRTDGLELAQVPVGAASSGHYVAQGDELEPVQVADPVPAVLHRARLGSTRWTDIPDQESGSLTSGSAKPMR